MHRLEVPDGISSRQAGRVLKGVIHIRQPGRRDARLRCIRALPLTFLIREGIMGQQGAVVLLQILRCRGFESLLPRHRRETHFNSFSFIG